MGLLEKSQSVRVCVGGGGGNKFELNQKAKNIQAPNVSRSGDLAPRGNTTLSRRHLGCVPGVYKRSLSR